MAETFNRGRGSIMAKMFSSPQGTGRGAGLVTPSQFVNLKPSNVSPTEHEQFENMEGATTTSHPPHVTDNTTEIKPTVEISKNSNEQKDSADSQTPSNSGKNNISSSNLTMSPMKDSKLPLVVDDDKTKADQEWKIYQCKRKINKTVKEVNDENLDKVMEDLENLLDECPLSSRYMNCSETRELLEALLQKAVQSDSFLQFAPCLVKMVFNQKPIEFKEYFADIVDAKRQEHVTLCASEEAISIFSRNFCGFLGHLVSMPRQTGNDFYEVVLTVVEEYVDRWSYPSEEEFSLNGFKENMACVYAHALKHLLIEISSKMLPCDNVLEQRMERYVWMVRESALNAKLPRRVREIFLDALIDIQIASANVEPTVTETKSDGEETAALQEDQCDENNDDEVIVEGYEPMPEEEEEERKQNQVSTEDPFSLMKYVLNQNELDELVEVFVSNNITDEFLSNTGVLKVKMEDAGIKKFSRFRIAQYIDGLSLEQLRLKATSASKTQTTEIEQQSEPCPSSRSSRLAINFGNAKKSVVDKIHSPSSPVSPTPEVSSSNENKENSASSNENKENSASSNENKENSASSNENKENSASSNEKEVVDSEVKEDHVVNDSQDSNVNPTIGPDDQVKDDTGSDSEPDLVIEEDGDDLDKYSTAESAISNSSQEEKHPLITLETRHKSVGTMPKGRGRGMISLAPLSPSKDSARKIHHRHQGHSSLKNSQVEHVANFHEKKDRSEGNWRSKPNGGNQWRTKSSGGDWSSKQKSEKRTNFNHNNRTKFAQPKFKPQYHPKQEKQTEKMEVPTEGGFGSSRPNCCLRCHDPGHFENACPVINPFF